MLDISSEKVKKKIIEAVKTHPEGLTIQDLSKIIGVHRQTITKYILFLEGAGTIYRRRIGSATLHYSKAQYEVFHAKSLAKNREGSYE